LIQYKGEEKTIRITLSGTIRHTTVILVDFVVSNEVTNLITRMHRCRQLFLRGSQINVYSTVNTICNIAHMPILSTLYGTATMNENTIQFQHSSNLWVQFELKRQTVRRSS
jgi:hypothetical protein